MLASQSETTTTKRSLHLFATLWSLRQYPSAQREWPWAKKFAAIRAAGFDGVFSPPIPAIAERGALHYLAVTSLGGKSDCTLPFAAARDLGAVAMDVQLCDYDTPLSERGGNLSQGQRQMLAIARILRTGAKLLLLDEISEGLAPVIVQTLGRVIRTLKERGYTIIIVEQNFRFAAPLADRHYVIEHGRIVETVTMPELDKKMDRLHVLLGV